MSAERRFLRYKRVFLSSLLISIKILTKLFFPKRKKLKVLMILKIFKTQRVFFITFLYKTLLKNLLRNLHKVNETLLLPKIKNSHSLSFKSTILSLLLKVVGEK